MEDESKFVAPKKLRFTPKDSAKRTQPQRRFQESIARKSVSSSEDSDHVDKHRQMTSIAIELQSIIVGQRKHKTEAFAKVSS
jgi:hypothetical protein